VQDFVHEFANLDRPDDVRSSHALDCLAAIYAEEKKTEDAVKSLDLLATKYDRIRARYWEYRKGALKAEEARA
jgi:protein farnesyltransferase/geranylgeranyltransferase type-1 subunit alpha